VDDAVTAVADQANSITPDALVNTQNAIGHLGFDAEEPAVGSDAGDDVGAALAEPEGDAPSLAGIISPRDDARLKLERREDR
jgi:hypothetical protein